MSFSISVDGTYVVGPAQNLTYTASTADGSSIHIVYVIGPSGDLIIQGHVLAQASIDHDELEGVYTSAFSTGMPTLDIASGGSFTLNTTATWSFAYGMYVNAGPGKFVNDGTFTVSSLYGASGLVFVGGGTIDNTGSTVVTGGAGFVQGWYINGAGWISNSGSLSATGVNAQAIVLYHYDGGTLTNSGTIIATATDAGYDADAIWLGSPTQGVETIVNTGTITAINTQGGSAFAIHAFGSTYFLDIDLTNGATGVINGDILLGNGSGSHIVNQGTINGAVTLGITGNDVYDGRGGTLSGVLTLGAGADTVYLGNDGETVHGGTGSAIVYGGTGADRITGGSGNDIVDGGGGNDVLDGGGGINTASFASAAAGVTVSLALQGSLQTVGSDSVSLSNFQNLIGSAFDDSLTGDAGDNVLDGGGGNDLLDGGGGTNTASFASASAGVTISLALQGQAQSVGSGSVTLSNIQNLTGSAFDDHLTGDGADNTLDAGSGGNDVLDGGGGTNTASLALATSGVTISLALQGQAQAVGSGSVTLSNFENLIGSAYADHLTGDGADNVIGAGPGGNDVLDGGDGVNTASFASAAAGVTVSLALQGSAQATGVGSDVLTHFQNLTGSAFNDTLEGDRNNNVLDGGAGVDTASYAHAASGVTVSLALQGAAQNTVGAGSDTLTNFESLTGSAYTDHLTGNGANNVIGTGSGGNDVLDGGGGVNTASFALAGAGVTVSLALQGSAQTTGVGSDTLSNFQNLTGSGFNDTLEGDGNGNVLDGGAGINTVSYAHAGAGVTVSLALQGAAQDTVGAGSDTLSNFRNIIGSAYADHLTGDAADNIIDGGGGDDTLDGGFGVNTVSFASASTGVTVSLALEGQAQSTGVGSETLTWFQNLIGSGYNDTLEGGAGDSVLDGGGGTNTLSFAHAGGVSFSLALAGQAQNAGSGRIETVSNFQNLSGSAYNDVLEGDSGDNVLDGGGGNNTVTYAHAGSGVRVSLALQGSAQNTVGAGADTLSNFLNLTGSAYDDTLEGDSGFNILDGAGGTNTVSYAHASSGVTVNLSLQGQAQYTGGGGTDTLSNFQALAGSAYNDTLTGSTGTSSLTGGAGGDTFKIASGAADTTITDFSHAQGDKIDLTALSQFTSLAGVMAVAVQIGSDTVIHTGSGSLTLHNVTATNLTASDFSFGSSAVTHQGVLAYPYNAVCLIRDTIGGVHYRASGVIVGPHTILTAAHVVWDQDSGQFATGVQVSPGFTSGYQPTYYAAAIHYIRVNDSGDVLYKTDAQNDYAIIDVAQNLTPYGWFDIAPDYSGPLSSGNISGYPGSSDYAQSDRTGHLTADPDYALIGYDSSALGVSPGSSGGPIWINEGTNSSPLPDVIGLVSTDAYGVQITSADLAQIQAWVAQDMPLFNDAAGSLTGSMLADHLVGTDGMDILDGKGGDDLLTGGGGSDIFVFKPGYGADTIADFSAAQGDRINLTAFPDLYYLQYVLADAVQSGPDTVIPLPGGGTVILANVAMSSLTSSDFYLAPSLGDFMGPGLGDLFWQNTVNSLTSVWVLNDTSVNRGISLPALHGWQVVDTGNFEAGAYAGDFLLRNTSNGMVDIWQDNNGVMSGRDVAQASLDWQIMGTADFNADGKSDILWRNEQNGYVSVWQMDGTNVSTTYNPGVVGLQWKLVGANDFYGDGKAEVLWRDSGTGEVNLWTIDGPEAGQTHGQSVGFLGNEWKVAGTGDFNGDGKADILWFDTVTGQVVEWEMNGPTVLAHQEIGDPGPQWRVVHVADISGDGKADVLWRDTGTGQVVAWAMDGFHVDHYGVVATVDNTWKLVDHNYDWA